jgi:hypothetical protein
MESPGFLLSGWAEWLGDIAKPLLAVFGGGFVSHLAAAAVFVEVPLNNRLRSNSLVVWPVN